MNRPDTNALGGTVNVRIGKVYMNLSKAHKKTADYVLSNVFRSATMSIDELANAVGISVATANRFARALGFEGYPQFRAELVCGFEAMLAPIDNLRSEVNRPASSTEIIAGSLNEDLANLEATRRALDTDLCNQAVRMILNAERIYIVGYGASAFLGGLMAHNLDPFCTTVQSTIGSGGPSTVARQLFKYTERDLIIGISFPRYAEDVVTILRQLHEKHVPILALTDAPSSPLAALANVTLYAQTRRHFSPNSEGAALCLIEAICSAVAHQAKAPVHAASEMTKFVLPWLYQDPNHSAKKALIPVK
ncbi:MULTISPECIES: MurR/RpiR family transcriptional regulator [unclassified Undibacterium]|uniref:MurR/RpiR family transcriptional regulator n=2 Tax=Oxalobacteraceae TaxID=75682 RepID=UPI002AC8A723|nr:MULTISPECIES: MurR/RpiR family transcriptional regulator [unclassified Undibacterium]MEB0139237.1 MurR/RpiR family transcriptional regulator [Undibacterium sp. CCC2.1]MEB0172081.1 MurR/RpiR family transcriptional regulator [Undibacterium sp. CCC1.1]MEB0175956.1 MurR/RpiR family transcriptional regulator [Undibacterium sp. CCC3.4]MEB0215268.1 MurR/RpiR family transcriptional regulator [Undibacterium sp. 5I2]WPX45443.1 MurR/RpiR family transcriptional regulator [Undibacterium sp. CCC3.4]